MRLPSWISWVAFVLIEAVMVSPGQAQGLPPELPKAGEEIPKQTEEFSEYSPVRDGLSRYGWSWLSERFDKNRNGRIVQQELPVSQADFSTIDQNWDGVLSEDDFNWSGTGELSRQKETSFALFKMADVNSDGRLTSEELLAHFSGKMKEQGYLNEDDLKDLLFRPRAQKALAEFRSRLQHPRFQMDDQGVIPQDLPCPDELAPDFELRTPSGPERIKLSSYQGKKPVVLVFGCLTCGNYRTYSEVIEAMYQQRKEEVEFLRVYVREAHPSDTDSPTATNSKAGILVQQPKTLSERCQVAERCSTNLHLSTPMVVDDIDNHVGKLYGGWPDRLYLIDKQGKVVYQGGPGPFAFNPHELEQNLVMLLLDMHLQAKEHE